MGGGYSRENVQFLTFCIVPLVRGKCEAFDKQRQIWQYKVIMIDGGENCHGFNKNQSPCFSLVRND